MPFASANSRNESELDEFYEKALKIPLESVQNDSYRLVVHRSANKLQITEEIIRELASSEYLVADLSGNPPNPNVMYELGVRFSISNSPVILIREKSSENKPIFDVSTLHTFHYDLARPEPLIEYIIDRIQAYETTQEHYISPVLQSLTPGVAVTKAAARSAAMRRLQIFERELEHYVELYGNICNKALESVGLSNEEFLQTIDDVDTVGKSARSVVREVERRVKDALSPPQSLSITGSEIDRVLSGLLPDKISDQVVECVQTFCIRFFGSNAQWTMDGQLASSIKFVRAALLLSNLLANTRKLLELEFSGPVDLDEKRRGWIMADHLQFVSDYGEYIGDLNLFRSRFLRWSSRGLERRRRKPSL